MLSPCLFNLHAEYIMQNARLDEAQAGNKIAGRYINNLKYADDTTLMAESEEELKSLLMKGYVVILNPNGRSCHLCEPHSSVRWVFTSLLLEAGN